MFSNTNWYEIWKDDKESIIETMKCNLIADINAGYDITGNNVKKQTAAIESYENKYYSELESFVDMEEKQVNRWCYVDLKRRGSID